MKGDSMPLVRIEMIKGKNREYKDKMLSCIHEGLVESIGIEDWDRFQRIVEIDKDDFETAPGKTDNFTIIEITMFPGRSAEQKKKIIEMIAYNLEKELKIQPTDIFIIINDPPNENWGLGGKQRIENL
jgi:4-oxalocrotonate tautomerase family enzyme